MRNAIQISVFTVLMVLSAITAQAQIFFDKRVEIQFAPDKIPAEATWSKSVSLNDNGLFSANLPPNTTTEVWVQSQPIPAGILWRPPTFERIKVDVGAGTERFTYLKTYVRYSCDRVHWSTWYNLSPVKTEEKIATSYEGDLSLPRTAYAPYYAKMAEWWKTNPEWSSDEYELCVWITRQDPEFFSRQFPFIGYIQVRLEGEAGGMQLKSLSVNLSAAVSGLTSPRIGGIKSTDEPWSFDVSKVQP
ncbi:MAG TPA: hypothetical protein VHS05_14810 [Pyrinomonadaceae bacterium]|jgi:hypothetical protein|nr:hypothetical protein [Pyrinomonadaceae bacterium]